MKRTKIIALSLSFVFASNFIFADIDVNTELNQTNQIVNDFSMITQLAASSKDYPVTAGDVYQLSFAAGSRAVTYPIVVDTSYVIKVANLATINCTGKTFMQLKKQVEEIVNKNYPMSGVQLVIVQPSVFKVTLKGEVQSSIEKKVWGLTRLSNILEDPTVLTNYSSTRNIEIIADDGTKKVYDIFSFIRNGDDSQDPYLRPDDVIYINRIDRKVTIAGAVERPNSYELLPGENLTELINKYGAGLMEGADLSRIEILRKYNEIRSAGRKIYLNEENYKNDFELKNYDTVYIYSYNDLKPVVFFEGAIKIEDSDTSLEASNKISVTCNNEENLAYFIRQNAKIFSPISDLKNAYLKRNSSIIPVNIDEILYNKDFYTEEKLLNYDIIVIPFKQSFVTVAGAVKNPGRYPYIPDRDWSYYIGLAGGFNKSENNTKVVSIVDINNKQLSKKDAITPETTITAETTAFTYYFNMYAPIITTTLSIISAGLTLYLAVNK